MKEINLNPTGRTLVDDDIYDKYGEYNWYLDGRGYVIGRLRKGQRGVPHNGNPRPVIRLHHLAVPRIKGYEVDHINRNKLDNRRSNLRNVTHSVNMLNGSVRSNNTSGVKGVAKFKRDNCWRAYAVVDNKQLHLGYFRRLEDAIGARRAFEKKLGVS